MSGALVTKDNAAPTASTYGALKHEFVTMRLDGQLFGISVMAVQDVLRRQPISPVPLAPKVVAGSLNIRGRIVTAIDMRKRLGMDAFPEPEKVMKVVVEYQHELFAFMVDRVGDVLTLEMNQLEKSPTNMAKKWHEVSAGVFKLDEELLVILDVASVIDG